MVSPDRKSRFPRSTSYESKLKKYGHLSGDDNTKALAQKPKADANERPSIAKIFETTTFLITSAVAGGAASAVFGKFSPLIGGGSYRYRSLLPKYVSYGSRWRFVTKSNQIR
jgi:hypothetical protein